VDILSSRIKSFAISLVPAQLRSWLRGLKTHLKRRPPIGKVRFGDLRRLQPIDRFFGTKWGQPIDRYYIEKFLGQNRTDIRGRVLEIAENNYTIRFGSDNVIQSDVLHVTAKNPNATIISDLTCADNISANTFDCIILTQTLQFIFDYQTAIQTLYRIMKPKGTLLVTFPGISQISRYDMENWGEYWRFTTLSAFKTFNEVFPKDCITVKAYGNILTVIAFLNGMVSEELTREELDHHDPDYELLITLRVTKPLESI
jgi:hypothetical protein